MGLQDWLRRLGLTKKPPVRREGARRARPAAGDPRDRTEGMVRPGGYGGGPSATPAPRGVVPPTEVHRPPIASQPTEAQRAAYPAPPAREPAWSPPPSPARAPYAPPPPRQGPSDAEETRIHAAAKAPQALVGVLAAVEGPLAGSVYGVGAGVTEIGRGSGCDIVTDSEFISRHHAKIAYQGGQFAIAPLTEKQPTSVNGVPIEGASELKDGDSVKMGQTTFRFRTLS